MHEQTDCAERVKFSLCCFRITFDPVCDITSGINIAAAIPSRLYCKATRYETEQEIPGKKLQAVLNQFARKALRVVIQEQNVAAYRSRPRTKREG